MNRSIADVLALGLATLGPAAVLRTQSRAQENGTILGRTAVVLPEYEVAKGYSRRDGSQDPVSKQWTRAQYEAARGDARFRLEKIVYASDGLRVTAYLYRPATLDGGALPTIIFNRGGGPQGEIAPVLAPFFRRLALHGFVVLAPMLRGSAGGEGRDEIGGADLADLQNAFVLAQNLESVDTDKLFLYGESRGGMMTYQALRDGATVRAAATFGGFTDLAALLRQQPQMVTMAQTIFPDFEARREEHLQRRSAVQWASEIEKTLLLMHGGADHSIDPTHPLHLALALQAAQKNYELVIYAEDGHTLSANQVARDERAVRWFRRFLK